MSGFVTIELTRAAELRSFDRAPTQLLRRVGMLEAHDAATCFRRGQSMVGSQQLHLMLPVSVRGHV